MHVDVPWGTTTVPVEVDERRVAAILAAKVEKASDPEGLLRSALGSPGADLDTFLSAAPYASSGRGQRRHPADAVGRGAPGDPRGSGGVAGRR